MEWYYAEDGKQAGPVTDLALGELVKAGKITPETLVWHAGLSEWKPYYDVNPSGAERVTPSSGAPCCAECGKEFPVGDMIQFRDAWVCAACKPIFFQRLQEGGGIPGVLEYAGFWPRAGSKILDTIILGVFSGILSAIFGGGSLERNQGSSLSMFFLIQLALMFIQMAVDIAYYTWFVGKYGATPGKMAGKMKVVRSDGSPVTYLRACARRFAEIVSGITLGIGYLMAAWDDEKRALHDRICDTRVIRNS